MKPTKQQRKIIDEWIHTSRFVYNKTVDAINKGHPPNHFNLRDKLVTKNTKKNNKDTEYLSCIEELGSLTIQKKKIEKELKACRTVNIELNNQLSCLIIEIKEKEESKKELKKKIVAEKNEEVYDWELETPKAIRDIAVSDVCNAHTTGFANLKLGNIKHFKIHFKKKTCPDKCIGVPKSLVTNEKGVIRIAPSFFNKKGGCCEFKMGKKTIKKYRDLKFDHDMRIVKQKDTYCLLVPIPQETTNPKPSTPYSYCGIDPGVRTFMTVFETNACIEYQHNEEALKRLNAKHAVLLNRKKNNILEKRVLKRTLNKIESRKSNLIDELHWKIIHDILNINDVVFYGDIKSHNISKKSNNRVLNRSFNDLKFYKFKQRLLFKATEKNKLVISVNEAFTSQTCSFCGKMYKPGCSKVYDCTHCHKRVDRDINAAKNILMKGILA